MAGLSKLFKQPTTSAPFSRMVGAGLVGVLLTFLSLAALVAQAAPLLTNWYVDAATGDDGNDCLSPVTACLTVTAAIAKANSGDTIVIAAGVYEESLLPLIARP